MLYDRRMPSPKIIPIRFTEDTISRLDKTSERMGTNRSALVRYLTDRFLAFYEAEGDANLPVNWRAIMNNQDGRRSKVAESEAPAETPLPRQKVTFEPKPKTKRKPKPKP